MVVGLFRIGVAITLSHSYNFYTLTQVVYVLFSMVNLNGTFALNKNDFHRKALTG